MMYKTPFPKLESFDNEYSKFKKEGVIIFWNWQSWLTLYAFFKTKKN